LDVTGLVAYTLLSLIALGALAISIWAIADAASKPSEAFRAAGSSRKKWMMVLVFFTIALDVIGVVLAMLYLATVRPKVRAVQHP